MLSVQSGTNLFGDVEVEDHHAEVVHYEGLPECKGLAVLHVSRPRPQEDQVQAADGQGGRGRRHHRPVLHPLVWAKWRVSIIIEFLQLFN